ncbi:hypothetical protein WJX73_007307 [Symbiochloris irregularis]|uniref:Uncharacterized protein n=1 Tax=Symbiochloris irregularis TaxID=706552 RepID=A0AAW1P1G2_9CHLO
MVGIHPSRTLTQSFRLVTPRKAWNGYCGALERQPLRIKAATAALGFTLGDFIAQLYSRPPQGINWRYDTFRTLRLAAYGGCIGGPIGHHWFGYLDRVIMPHKPKSAAAIASKIGLDQLIMAPIGTILFFSITKLLDGFQAAAVIPTVQEKLVPTVLASYKLWPLAHSFNFAFVPSSQRILYINTVAILWTFMLSRAAASTVPVSEPAPLELAAAPAPVLTCLPPDEEPATASVELLEVMHNEDIGAA